MSKRKMSIPARTLRKKRFQAGKDQNTDTMEIECNTATERQGTEGIAMEPGEDEEPVTINHNLECKKQRTDLDVSAVEEKGRVNGSQEGEQLSFPLSQNSAGRYVPVFPKPKNRLARSDSLKNVLQKTSKESSNISKTEGDDRSHGVVLEGSGFSLATTKHQEQTSQQPSEQFASDASQLDSKVSGNMQQEIFTDDNCIQQGSNNCVSHSTMQVGTDFVDHSIEGLMCYSNPINPDVTEGKNNSSKLGSHQYEMDALCSTPIPVAHSTAFEPLTQTECKTQNLSTSISGGEPNNELLHHFSQETIDKVPVTHEEVASQNKQSKWALVISKNADKNVESSVLAPEELKDITCIEETRHVVCEVSEANKQEQELLVQMNMTGDLKGTKCSQPVGLSLDTNAENQLETYNTNSQPNIMDKCQINSQPDVRDKCGNVNAKMPESPNSVRNRLLMNFESQNGSNSNWSDMNVPAPSMIDRLILHRDSGGQDVKLQEQLSQCFSEVKRTESVSEMHPSDQAETDIAGSHEHQEITQNSYETIHVCGDNIEGCNSINCHSADEETKLLIQEALSENHDSGAISTDTGDQKCDSFGQGRPGERCVGSNESTLFGTQLANSALICSEADVSKSPVAFKVCAENSNGSVRDVDLERGSQISEKTLQNININLSQTPAHPANNEEVIPDIEVNSYQIHVSDKCNGKGTEDAGDQIINNMSLATTKEVIYNKLSSQANQGFQIGCHMSAIEDSGAVDLNRKEIQQDVSSETKNEDVTTSSQISGDGIDGDVGCPQEEKKQNQDGGSMECGGVNRDENDIAEEHRVHLKEEDVDKSDMFNQTFFSVEEMDLQVSCDLAAGDKNTLPRSGQNLTTISVASSQHQAEDFTVRHDGDLSMTLPTSSVESAAAASVHKKANTESNDNVEECKGYSLSMAHERSSTMAQERVNSQHVTASWTVKQKDESEQTAHHSTNCEVNDFINNY
ncbi:uncharacterized protein LOC129714339 [Leucoraja erinacea]|uniref:uncharacterized protein LOC129714339 n=1 Tax=Leucoraja erinaceus TaxID=7782 RepID=UPI0024539E19|nr:uncharacterized protein LOC129714339 [Leucoraja erinacea]